VSQPLILRPDDCVYDDAVEALYARAFGPGRFAKAAARLRESNTCLRALSSLAFDDDSLVGACRLWPVVTDRGDAALFLGPIAVDATMRGSGLGQRLVEACLAAAQNSGDERAIILVGDMGFFAKMGFQIVPKGQLAMPGPVDPARLLWCISGGSANVPQGKLSVPRATIPRG
jgi:predicted N-acetyltransferase YhbS